MKISDFYSGLLLALFGIWMAGYGFSLPEVPGQSVGPGVFPISVGLLFVIFGSTLSVGRLKQKDIGKPVVLSEDYGRIKNVLRLLSVFVALVVFVLGYETLGFILVSMFLLGLLFLAFGVRWTQALLYALILPFAIHFSFYKLLSVPLAWGLLNPIAW